MKKIIIILILLASFRLSLININSYSENKKNINIIGKIVYISEYSDKVIIHIKKKEKYQIVLYEKVNYELGDVINVEGIRYTPSNNTVFNLFNYKKYLLSKNIRYCIKTKKIILISKNKNIFYKLKNNIVNKINIYKSKSYLKTFILGDSNLIEENIKDNYKNIGISHLFALSGMHISLFISVLNTLLNKYKYKKYLIYLLLLIYIFLTGFQISLIRCFLLIIAKEINIKYKLELKNDEIIISLALIFVILNPYYIYNIGFLFSFIITYFIYLSKDILIKNKGIKKNILITVICFLSSIPLLAYNFFNINFLSIIFNLLLVPIITFIIFPLSLITFLFSFLDNTYFIIISYFENIICYFSKIKFLTFAISKISIIIPILYYLFLYLSIKKDKKLFYFYIILLIFNLNTKYFILNPKITILDVGQGDCGVLVFPKGFNILIDTGGIYNNEGLVFKNKIKPYLNSLGINKINLLILTHGDYDHMGDAVELVNNFKVENVIFNCGDFNDLELELIDVLKQKNINYYFCIKELNVNKYKLQFLNTEIYDNENDNSNVIYLNYNNYKFLFMGDASISREEDILKKYNIENIDFLKVGHHGSNTSSGENFINSINPKCSIISVGENNRYGHPKASVLDILEKNDSEIYRTDEDGSIEIKIKRDGYSIETCEP